MYAPGASVHFSLHNDMPAGARIRYSHLAETIAESSLSGREWQWTVPMSDFKGYLAEIYLPLQDKDSVLATIGIDVSSEYKRFPRNGFLSSFGSMTQKEMDAVIEKLNRYHINVVQLQDWEYKHHMPLAGSVANPAVQWKDIANRDNYYSTVKYYVDAAHACNMKALSYNLAYGALSDAAADGVASGWYLFKDAAHTQPDLHPLGNPFKSSIYLLDPSNSGWQEYIAAKTKDAYDVFGFDGWQVDQLGDRGTTYDAQGNPVQLASSFKGFLEAMKAEAPDKILVMNAVNQYGQQSIAQSPVDFLYTEVWSPNESYRDLADIIQNNETDAGGNKRTVLAAYMNYDLANNPGYFNTAAVLLTDAVIFAWGGSHLELGEHMLGKEYFPNSNLQMRPDLQKALPGYYDFMVAYENLLRDGGSFYKPAVNCSNGKMMVNSWPPAMGQVSVLGKELPGKKVLHFLNFSGATHLNWRDSNGTQATPATITDAAISLTCAQQVKKVWIASPDDKSVARTIPFNQNGSTIQFSLPGLQYWDMVVLEY